MISHFEFQKTDLKDAYLIRPFISTDRRGNFVKDYNEETFRANGIDHPVREVFYADSQKGVLRGMHFQLDRQQAKLVRCVKGKIYDVIVDLRPDSPTYLQSQGFELSAENFQELYVPTYFAHGYLTLEDATVVYKCSEVFYPAGDSGIRFDDPDLRIDWPFDLVGGKDKLILSDKDMQLKSFRYYLQHSC